MNAWLFVGIGAFVSVADFAIGLYLVRRGTDSPALDTNDNARPSAQASQRAGRLIMAISPVPVILLSLVGFFIIGGSGL